MPRIVTKFGFLKPRDGEKPGGYAKYIATREGVEKELITKTYADYIATRPRSHGLFSDEDIEVNLERVSSTLNEHEGNVWTGIISITREDAERLGYNSVDAWETLLRSNVAELSNVFKIPICNLHWYAAFHNESHHPHVHMIVYSDNPKEGYLSKKGIENFRSSLANSIFQLDLYEIYKKQTKYRDDLKDKSTATAKVIVDQIRSKRSDYSNIEKMLITLTNNLRNVEGKKSYGYLSKSNKRLVDEIVRELAKDENIKQLYELWYGERENVLRTYTDEMPPRIALENNPEFKSIKNVVIKTVVSSGVTLQYLGESKKETEAKLFSASLYLMCEVADMLNQKIIDEKPQPHMDKKQYRKIARKKQALGMHY